MGIVFLNQILLVNQENSVAIGKPFLDEEYVVKATVLRHISGPKIRVYKMNRKKKTRKTFGSRRKLTRVLINSISKKTKLWLRVKRGNVARNRRKKSFKICKRF